MVEGEEENEVSFRILTSTSDRDDDIKVEDKKFIRSRATSDPDDDVKVEDKKLIRSRAISDRDDDVKEDEEIVLKSLLTETMPSKKKTKS